MSKYWSPIVSQLTPYVPGEQPKVTNLVKLNTNENPYPPSPKVLDAIHHAANEHLRLYPDPSSSALRQTIASYHGVGADNVFIGNGSDEVLALVFQGLLKHDLPILYPDISYSFYPVYCGLYEIEAREVPLREDFTLNVQDYTQANGGIIFANPNAPTGISIPASDIEWLLQQHPDSIVIIDEAYVDFGAESVIPLTQRYPNLLVTQTLSKSRSLAGMRVGLAIGHEDLIDGLNRVKNSFNSYPIDRIASAASVASYEDETYFQKVREKVMATREQLVADLRSRGFEVLPSHTNFVFARHPEHDAKAIASGLREQSVIVRHFTMARINQYLRISIGTDAECQALIKALDSILEH
ncbi:histidinol-phosphate transaminase [Pokkaliibacter sp. CJK22405]|uniref:histidinol-phosphate transaminase n=1 Tax=Pokkaliibacter sp. CJK22405 TaxID=3384615 RepID=UPI00398473F2